MSADEVAPRIAASFARQPLMATLGARLVRAVGGETTLVMDPSGAVLQQHGFVHGGTIMALADTAAGYAAMLMVPEGSEVLTIECKTNFLRPARGKIVAEGRLIRAGRTVIVAGADVFAEVAGRRVHAATALATLAVVTHVSEV
jgi:uncharacterized protein (TIGR00369 family)